MVEFYNIMYVILSVSADSTGKIQFDPGPSRILDCYGINSAIRFLYKMGIVDNDTSRL